MASASDPGFDPYRELGLSPEAETEPELIRAAFKALAKKYHPDAYPDSAGKAMAEDKMRRLNEAQRQILSGEYRPSFAPSVGPPAPDSFVPSIATAQTGSRQPGKPTAAASTRRKIPQAPMMVASILLLLCLVLPGLLRRDHVAEALRLEEQGQFAQAVGEADLAVADDPRDGTTYLLRARLWQKLGKPQRAATDMANARSLLTPEQMSEATSSATPSASPTPKGDS